VSGPTHDRRGFLHIGAGAAAAGLLGAGRTAGAAAGAKARVVLIRRREVLDAQGRIDPAILHGMLNDAVAELLGEKDAAEAWRRLVQPPDVVGIKSNGWGPLRTPSELEQAIRDEVVRAGVRPDNVAVDDQGVRSNSVFRRMTALVNVRPMRTHSWSGLGTCVKNVIMFVPSPSDYHDDACATLGAIWHLPALEGKVRLNVLVMLTPQFHSVGPHSFAKEFSWPYGGLIVGTQPVPVDATGARIIQAKRREHFGADRPISPPPHHIEIAGSRYGLGPSDPSRIDLVRLGWTDGALI
jgi:hypothetical protein